MKSFVATLALLLCGAGIASAQDDPERKMDELRRDMERSLKGLQEKFDAERERLQKEFKAARERLLEKKLDHQLPRLQELPKELPHFMPKDFDFKRFQDGVPDEWRHWLEQMPKFRGGEDFKFEFRSADPKKNQEKGEERPEKPKKKPEHDDSY